MKPSTATLVAGCTVLLGLALVLALRTLGSGGRAALRTSPGAPASEGHAELATPAAADGARDAARTGDAR